MADARVIPMDGERARGRRPGADSVLAGADRASGERARRRARTTPLLAARESVTAGPEEIPTPAEVPAAKRAARKAPAKRSAGREAAATPADVAAAVAPATKVPAPAKKVAATPVDVAAAVAPATKVPAPAKKVAATPADVAAVAPAKKAAAKKSAAKKATAKKAAESAAKRAKRDERPAELPGAKLPGAKAATPPPAEAPVAPAAAPKKPAAERVPPAWAAAAQAESRARAASRPATVTASSSAAAGDEPPVAGGRFSLAAGIAAQAGAMLVEALDPGRRRAEAEAAVARAIEFLTSRLSGTYEVDEFGFDPEFADALIRALLLPVYKRWFRVEVRGVENIPETGGALIVANHSGTLPVDAMMTAVAVHEETPTHRFLRALGADLVFQTPVLADLARKGGVTLATTADAERLLSEGHVVGVWPEGFKGIGKPFTERYKLQRFGRGGFVSAALRTGTPIVPCSIVGAEEIFPIIGDVPALARLFGLPYVPITPFFPWLGPLGAIPLPSKWLIEFGPPIPTDEHGPAAADDPMLVFDITDRVRQTIQQTLYALLVQRRSIFF